MRAPTRDSRAARQVALLAAAALLAGCGGGPETPTVTRQRPEISQNERTAYQRAVASALDPVIAASERLEAAGSRGGDRIAQPLGAAARAYSGAAEALAGIEPPADVVELHERLVEASQDLADATQAAARRAGGGAPDSAALRDALDRYREEMLDLSVEFADRAYPFAMEPDDAAP